MIWNFNGMNWIGTQINRVQAMKKAAFLYCPGPSLAGIHEPVIYRPGIFTAAINTAYPKISRPDVWIGGDNPISQHPNLMYESFQKIFQGGLSAEDEKHNDIALRSYFNTHFVDVGSNEFPSRGRADNQTPSSLCWRRSTFLLTLDYLIECGFIRIYLVGCDFGGKTDYWYGDILEPEQRASNVALHDTILRTLVASIRKVEEIGVTLISCTPDSPLNHSLLEYVPIYMALERETINKETPDFKFQHIMSLRDIGK
jgi:hypothetical protein